MRQIENNDWMNIKYIALSYLVSFLLIKSTLKILKVPKTSYNNRLVSTGFTIAFILPVRVHKLYCKSQWILSTVTKIYFLLLNSSGKFNSFH